MTIREDFLGEKLERYLSRKTMPRGLDSKPAARDEELQALMRCLTRYAPRERYDEWWPRFEDRLSEDAQTRAWPSEGEIKKAALSIRERQTTTVSQGDEIDPVKVNAERIQRGEAVGDGWLWGRLAVELLQSGRVTMAQLRPYRSALYFSEKDFYGEETARKREQEREARHQHAEEAARETAE